MSHLRVTIPGCTGRTGRAVVRLAVEDPDVEIAAAVALPDDPLQGADVGSLAGVDSVGVVVTPTCEGPCDAVIEFTTPTGFDVWLAWCVERGVPLVSGTTRLSDAQMANLASAAGQIPIVWAPNMSIGINLMRALVRDIAARLGPDWDVEICETHHRRKIDAPSGTALALLEDVSAARNTAAGDAVRHGRIGECGPRKPGEIGVHALRMGLLVGEHEVHFTSDTESLTLRHRALSRDTFAAGALRAAHWLQGREPGLYTMADVLS